MLGLDVQGMVSAIPSYLSRWCLAGAAALLMAHVEVVFAFDPPPFPRIGGIQINPGSTPTYNDPAYQASLAKQNLMILGGYPGFAPGGESMQSVVQSIKALNPTSLVFMYVQNTELPLNASDASNSLRTELNTMDWWLYNQGTKNTPSPGGAHVLDPSGGDALINNTLNTPKDSSGNGSVDWMTQWLVTNFYTPMTNIDGFYMDEMFAQAFFDGGDYNRDGTSDSKTNPQTSTWLRQGFAQYVTKARTLMPAKYQIGNITDWGVSTSVLSPEYINLAGGGDLVDGGVLEGYLGKSWSLETWGGWSTMMAAYRRVMASVNAPKLVIFGQFGDKTDYQSMRYGLASCLMDDGYYSFTDVAQTYEGVIWFDEYDAHLGQSLGPPVTTPLSNGVYRRDFANGIALVNPKGNGVQTVNLESDYLKLLGTQDPSLNDGSTVRSVTLQDRDGILLLRKSKTFGQTTVGNTPSTGMIPDYKRASKFTLSEAGVLTGMFAYLDGNGGTSGSQAVRTVLYRDSSGVPGSKVADSTVVNIASGASGSWANFTTPFVSLTAGSYWMAIQTGATGGVARDVGDGSSSPNWYGNADVFTDGGSDPYGSGNTGTGTLSVYASYLPGTLKQFGQTTVGNTPSTGFIPDYKRGSKFTLGETGTLVSFSAYLDGLGGGSGSQSVRIVLYQDSGGVPGAKVIQSSTVSIASGTAGGWVTFPAPQTSLTPGSYWIVIQSGTPGGIARDVGDGSSTLNWYGNADTFSDGASDPFGSGNTGTGTLSVHVNYVH